jgi:hypothetical protein
MAGSGFAVDTTSGGIERRIQAECSVPVVLEAVTFGASRRERQGLDRDGPRLEWRSSVNAEHGRVLGRAQIKAENIGRFAFELGIVTARCRSRRCGFRPASCQTRCTASLLTLSAEANLRQLQCVDASLGLLRVADSRQGTQSRRSGEPSRAGRQFAVPLYCPR